MKRPYNVRQLPRIAFIYCDPSQPQVESKRKMSETAGNICRITNGRVIRLLAINTDKEHASFKALTEALGIDSTIDSYNITTKAKSDPLTGEQMLKFLEKDVKLEDDTVYVVAVGNLNDGANLLDSITKSFNRSGVESIEGRNLVKNGCYISMRDGHVTRLERPRAADLYHKSTKPSAADRRRLTQKPTTTGNLRAPSN